MNGMTEQVLAVVERQYKDGVSSAELMDVFASHGTPLSEATLRKYVQLGLLPRSRRIGQKGKHQGSKGVYPVSVFRSVVRIRELMASNFTIEQIQNEFFFIRSDIEQLDSTLESIFSTLREVLKEKEKNGVRHVVARDVKEAKALSVELSERLLRIEDQISSQAPVSVVKVS